MCFNFFFLITLGSSFAKKAKYWLERSEWTDVITNAKIQTSGSSEAILSATHKKNSICSSGQCCSFVLCVEREF